MATVINFMNIKAKNPHSPPLRELLGAIKPPLSAKLSARMTNNATIKRGPSLRPQSEAGTSPDGKKHRFDKDMLKSIGKELLENLLPKFQEMVDGGCETYGRKA